jgi:hypothetical protein
MTAAAPTRDHFDQSDLRRIVRCSVQLGLLEAALVLAFSLGSRFLDGVPETVVRGLIVVVGLAAVTLLPGLWTRPRTIEGIAGAAGIGLGATVVFLLVDVALLQPLGTYTNRWLEIGGGSNWWYHPVWWMLGTFLPWMGAFALANQTARQGAGSPGRVFGTALVLAGIFGGLASAVGVPGAGLDLGTFAVAFIPGIGLTVLLTARRAGAR